MMAESEYK